MCLFPPSEDSASFRLVLSDLNIHTWKREDFKVRKFDFSSWTTGASFQLHCALFFRNTIYKGKSKEPGQIMHFTSNDQNKEAGSGAVTTREGQSPAELFAVTGVVYEAVVSYDKCQRSSRTGNEVKRKGRGDPFFVIIHSPIGQI